MKALSITITLAVLALSACAYDASGLTGQKTLIFQYSVAGSQLVQSNNLAYYFILNTGSDTTQMPLVNGPAPLSFPYPDPRSYLPFVRDDLKDLLDRQPIGVPVTTWTDYFALYQEGGQMVMWQGRQNADGTVNEHFRQLQNGREWGIQNGNTVQITLPFNQLSNLSQITDPTLFPPQLSANLAVATRAQGGTPPQGLLIDRWGQTQNQDFTLKTQDITENGYNTVGGVTYPQNLGGLDPNSVDIVSYTYRVVSGQ
jgi:hypothetical protein